MQFHKLGRTGLSVSEICLGTMTWGVQNTEAEGHAQIDYALDKGVNFIDTAEVYAIPSNAKTYGATEKIIGSWIADNKGRRGDFILATKIVGPGRDWIRDGSPISPENIRAAVDGSLARLQTDYIDLYQLHWPNRGHPFHGNSFSYVPSGQDTPNVLADIEETLETLDALVRAGKIRHVGLSNETAWGTMQFLRIAEEHDLPRVASVQNDYSLLNRLFDTDGAETAQHEDVGLLAYSGMGGGMLSGKYQGGVVPAGSRGDIIPGLWGRLAGQATHAVDKYVAVAKKHNLDPGQMALAFVLGKPFLTSLIIGATSMDQLKLNIDAVDVTLSDEVHSEIVEIFREYPFPT